MHLVPFLDTAQCLRLRGLYTSLSCYSSSEHVLTCFNLQCSLQRAPFSQRFRWVCGRNQWRKTCTMVTTRKSCGSFEMSGVVFSRRSTMRMAGYCYGFNERSIYRSRSRSKYEGKFYIWIDFNLSIN